MTVLSLNWCMDRFIFPGSYELCHTYGCFESSDTQLTVTLDGDEVYYADFKKGVLVWESRLATMLHISWAYQDAVYYRSICKSNLLRWKPDKSAKERPKGERYSTRWCNSTCVKDTISVEQNSKHIKWFVIVFARGTRNHDLPQRWCSNRGREHSHLLHQPFLPTYHQH